MKIGVFFGGQSREREVSFAGGRTVYDNLDKSIFTAVPIFIDSWGNFILLDWQFVYKGTIRDFYPPVSHIPKSENGFQIYTESLGELSEKQQEEMIAKIGKKIQPSDFKKLFDFAFLTLHGSYGEDGNIQGLLEWYHIPYSGAGILSSAIGIDKAIQKKLFSQLGFLQPKTHTISRSEFSEENNYAYFFNTLQQELGLPFVVKAAHQGSSIGISVLNKKATVTDFVEALEKAFFIEKITSEKWKGCSQKQKVTFLVNLTDIREGIGLPVLVRQETEKIRISHPEKLLLFLNNHFENSENTLFLEALESETEVLLESFVNGKEFSCIVVQDENGKPIALPPTEIVKGAELFDYRSKY